MKVIVTNSYDESCAVVAGMIRDLVNAKPNAKLGLATGGTPVPIYQKLAQMNKAGEVDFSAVHTVNLDEYCGLPGTHDQSYRYFMQKNLFDHIDILPENTYVPSGLAEDPEEECRRYDELVKSFGYADLQLLGLGRNGHIGFNEPADEFDKVTHCVDLQESTIEANKRFFASADDVPRQAYTMGIQTIMRARTILMVVSGEDKAQILHDALCGPITPHVPASILQLHNDVIIVASQAQYKPLLDMLMEHGATSSLEERRWMAKEAFAVSSHYDSAIFNYFDAGEGSAFRCSVNNQKQLRYGENPHQKGYFYGNLDAMFDQIHGKEISYNNLLDINAAVDLIDEYEDLTFAILKHNNACGLASRPTVLEAWTDALAGDPVSAFGGVLITNGVIDKAAAEEINKIFFEVIIAPDYDVDALEILGQKKNRIILVRKEAKLPKKQFRALLNGVLVQDKDMNIETVADLRTVTDKAPTPEEVEDLLFANKIVKNSKSNAIVLAKGKQLLASGVGQTSRVDALKQAIEKAKSFGFDLNGAVMASDAFFPFPDCVEIADKEGITAVIQPGGSVKDDLTFAYCNEHGMAMVTTGIRHFKH